MEPREKVGEHGSIYSATAVSDANNPNISEAPPSIDPAAAARWLRVAPGASPWLHEEVGGRMAQRLQWIRRAPQAWADWHAVRGGLDAHARVTERYPGARCYVVEDSPAMTQAARSALGKPWWQRTARPVVVAGAPPDASVQLVWSNMLLHNWHQPRALMASWHRALAVDGFLMFSCLGPDTLRELRSLYSVLGWPPAGHDFTDMHDWGDMLVQAGFAEPVMDMERITLSFAGAARMLAEWRELGRNLHPARFPALRGRAWREDLLRALGGSAGESGTVQCTFEIIYGHAFKPAPRAAVKPRSEVPLADMQAMLRGGRGGGGPP